MENLLNLILLLFIKNFNMISATITCESTNKVIRKDAKFPIIPNIGERIDLWKNGSKEVKYVKWIEFGDTYLPEIYVS